MGESEASRLSLGTFHRVCLSLLRETGDFKTATRHLRPGFCIYDAAAMVKLVALCVGEKPDRGGLGLDKKVHKPTAIQSQISSAKNAQISALRYAELADEEVRGFDPVVAKVFELYEKGLDQRNAVDFDDMLLLTAAILRDDHHRGIHQAKWRHVLVDEFQDTNGAQYEILKLLTCEHRDVFVVGDSDQAIYGWRGADYTNQRKFDKDFAVTDDNGRRLRLETNYRSTQRVLDAAMALISSVKASAELAI